MSGLSRQMRTVLISLFILTLCAAAAAADDDDNDWDDYYEDYDDDYDDDDSYNRFLPDIPYGYAVIPPGHLPPPGECRIWVPGIPPGHQPPPFDCSYFVPNVPAGGLLLYRHPY